MAVTEKEVREALKGVKDPELGLDVVVLGLVYDIDVQETGVKAVISLTSPLCPVAGEIVEAYVRAEAKTPWYIDLLNINIDNVDLEAAKERIRMYLDAFSADGTRITENLDFA